MYFYLLSISHFISKVSKVKSKSHGSMEIIKRT